MPGVYIGISIILAVLVFKAASFIRARKAAKSTAIVVATPIPGSPAVVTTTTTPPSPPRAMQIAKLTGVILGLLLLLGIGILGWKKYNSAPEKPDPRVVALKHSNDSLEKENARLLSGEKKWDWIVYKGHPDSLEIPVGDSVVVHRQDSVVYKFIVNGKEFPMPLNYKAVPKLPFTGWLKVAVDENANADSIHFKSHEWRAKWTTN
jgi:hypothetical protein